MHRVKHGIGGNMKNYQEMALVQDVCPQALSNAFVVEILESDYSLIDALASLENECMFDDMECSQTVHDECVQALKECYALLELDSNDIESILIKKGCLL